MYRKRKYRRRVAVVLLVCCLIIGAVLVISIDAEVRPLVQSYGCMAARRSAMIAVHTGVETALASQTAEYRELVTLVRDEEGRILSAEANVGKINRLKAAATNAVMAELVKREKQTVRIPLGNIIGGSFFTGRGPFLEVPVYTSGTVISNLSGSFSDAGINQTNHRLQLDMTLMITAALPMERVAIELTTSFLVSETVLVGVVPDTVAQLDFGEGMQNIFGTNH